LLPLLASEAPEPVGNLLGVYAQAPQSTISDSDDDRAGLLTSPNTSPLAGPNVGPITGTNAVTSSQVTGSAALAPVLISPALGLFGASAALVSWDNRDSNSQTAPPSDSTAPIFISKASVSENTPTSTVVHTVLASDNRGVSQNFSVQDKLTNDVFVYYFGDPDGAGVGVWTEMDNGDSASNTGIITTNKDNDTPGFGDFDYYNNPTANANAASTPATASNTALHLVTNISAQIWEFHMGANNNLVSWSTANAQATDHGLWGSNTSRLASLAEMVALYAVNFGGNNAGGNTVHALQPMSNVGGTNAYADDEVNSPVGWGPGLWTAASTPSGHALAPFGGRVNDTPDTGNWGVSAVL
jgi:hypothetical protein